MTYRAHKSYAVKAEPVDETGIFEAIVSVFGNVDLVGDRVVKGAFSKSLEQWAESGDPIPVIWSHQWSDPKAHLGEVLEVEERDAGLWIRGKLDIEDDATYAPIIWRKMGRRLVKEFSFAYDVYDEKTAEDGANDLLEVELLEVGPCLKGVNPDTQLLSVKAAIAAHGTGTSDGPWDGPANEANLSTDAGASVYRTAYAWQDPEGDPDVKSSYRFIHHEVSSDGRVGAANVTAAATGIGVLNGGRGGTTIPDADRQGVWNHLAGHLRDADREPPPLKGRNPGDVKTGRVLSAKNEQQIRDAVRMLQSVLAQLETTSEADDATKRSANPKTGEERGARSPFSLLVLTEADIFD